MSYDEESTRFKRTKKSDNSTNSKMRKYMLCDDDTDEENDKFKITSDDDYDGVWINVNDLPIPFYPLKEYEPKFTITDEDIIEDSPTGTSTKRN